MQPKTGSSFPSGIPNNTDIKQTYGAMKAQRAAAYKLKMEQAQERARMWERQDEQREQAQLAEEFAAAEPMQENVPDIPAAEPTIDAINDPALDEELMAAQMAEAYGEPEIPEDIPPEDMSAEDFEATLDEDDIIADEDF